MNQQKLDKIASFGYGVYEIPAGVIVADPLDDSKGFYLESCDLDEAYLAMEEMNLLTKGRKP